MPKGGKQARKLYDMSHFLSSFIERIFIRYLSSAKPPQNEFVSFYIGKTTNEIINLHEDYIVDNLSSIIEIRLSDSTLTCEMYKDICIDARLFRDKESLCKEMFFDSNHLKN